MYVSLGLIIIISFFSLLYFYCIKKGIIDTKKICWLLPAAAILGFFAYGMYGAYPKTAIPTMIVVLLVVYILIVLKV